jgi:hypothetical protein
MNLPKDTSKLSRVEIDLLVMELSLQDELNAKKKQPTKTIKEVKKTSAIELKKKAG